MSLNKVLLIGNLTRDPQLRYLPSGTAVAEFGIAINRRYKGQDGQQKEEVCFVDITTMGRQAETCSQYLSKGRPALIEGRLQFDQWEAQDGQKRSKLKVFAERVQFLGSRSEAPKGPAAGAPGGGGAPEPEPADENMTDNDVPF